MTTVIYSKKHKQLLADRQIGMPISQGSKIFKSHDGTYITGAGYYDDLSEVARWVDMGHPEDSKPQLPDRGDGKDSDFLLVDSLSGLAYWLTCPYLRRVPIDGDFYTLGTGGQFALGALIAGATPVEAMGIAASLDPYTSYEYDMFDLAKGKKPSAKRR